MGQNLATTDFGNYLGRLSALSGLGLQGASLDTQNTATYNNLLSRTASDMSNNATGAATQQASIYSKDGAAIGSGISGALGIAQKNGLLDFGSSGGGNFTTANPYSGSLPTGWGY